MFRNLLVSSFLALLAGITAVPPALGQAPPSFRFLDAAGQPIPAGRQFTEIRIEVTDPASAGSGYLLSEISSDLRGHLLVQQGLSETSPGSGVFVSQPYRLIAQLPSDPLPGSGLAVTEDFGPPHRFDTVRARLDCGAPPCPEATLPTFAASLRLLDAAGAPLARVPVGDDLLIEGWDDSGWSFPVTLFAQPGGDLETLELPFDWQYSGGVRFRALLPTAAGPAVAGDGVLQIEEGGTLTALHDNFLGLSTTEVSLPTGAAVFRFVDRDGEATESVLAHGPVRLLLVADGANLDPESPDLVTVPVRTVDPLGGTRDSEEILLTETGPSTGTFQGEIEGYLGAAGIPGDGRLDEGFDGGQLDSLEAVYDGQTIAAPIVAALVRVVDAAGNEVSEVSAGDDLRIEVESEFENHYWTIQEDMWVNVRSLTTGDEELSFPLVETGLDTSIFSGSLPTAEATPASPGNGVLEVQPRETLTVDVVTFFGTASSAVTVSFVPISPTAVDDAASVEEDGSVLLSPAANDLDPDQAGITIEAVGGAAHGLAELVDPVAGTVRYTPNGDYHGDDAFTYTLNGGSTATVTVTVASVPDAPLTLDDSAFLDEDTFVIVDVLANDVDGDGDPLQIAITQGPTHGTAIVTGGQIRYTPSANYAGSDILTYRAVDPSGRYGTDILALTVRPVNDPPVAVADSRTTNEDVSALIVVTANDQDPDGDSLAISTYTQPAHGTLTPSYDLKSLTYRPAANYFGPDSFAYTVSDGKGGTSSAAVTLSVVSVNDRPTALPDGATTPKNVAVTIPVLANDSDVEGSTLSLVSVTSPASGTAVRSGSNVIFTPAPGFVGIRTFTYTVSDGSLTNSATVRVTVLNTP